MSNIVDQIITALKMSLAMPRDGRVEFEHDVVDNYHESGCKSVEEYREYLDKE